VIMAGIGALTAQVALREAAATPEPTALADVEGGVRIPDRRAAILYGRHCARCHGVDGEPTGEVAEARDFRSPDFARMAASDFDALLGTVEYGGDKMPAFGDELSTDEMEAILRQVVLPLSADAGGAAED